MIPDPVVRLDRDLRYITVNRAAAAAAGMEPQDVIGRRHADLSLDPAAEAPLREAVGRAFDTGELQVVELRYDFGGTIRWYESRIAPERDEAGEVQSVVVVARDISHLKGVEHALGERVKELRCLYACSTALSEAGEGLEEALRKVVAAMPTGWQFPEVAVARVCVGELDVRSAGYRETEHVQVAPVVVGATNVGFVELGYLEPRRFVSEEDELISAIATRIGETVDRLDAERQLTERSAHFRALVAASTDMIGILEADATVKYLSPSAEALLGSEPESFVGTDAMDLVHPDDREQVSVALASAVATPGGLACATYRLRRTDGSYRTVETTGRNMLHDPSVRGLVTSTRDLTERRALETQLHQAQKMEAVGRLAGGIAHDFNNVLTIIDASASLLAEELAVGDPRLEDVDEIRQAAQRAAGLTRRLLAFSRKQVMQPQLIALPRLVHDMEKLLRRLIGEDVHLVTHLHQNGHLVRADPGQIEQVLLNLVVNAREAMPKGGRITLTSGTVERADGDVESFIEVTDTGVGMDDETLERIFDPFFTTKKTGTGLGLATVYGIVKQSGGAISVWSSVGEGTRFRVTLPVAGSGELPVRDSVAPSRRPEPGSETVLVVEDEDALREVARRILERRGYRALLASSGEEALAIARDQSVHIDLLLVDVVMPGMSGRETAEAVQELRPDLRVLYTSGYLDDAILRHGVQQSEMRLLAKPFTPAALSRAVRRALDDAA